MGHFKKHTMVGALVVLCSVAGLGCSTYQVTYEAADRINNCGMPEGRETQPFEVVLVMPGDPEHTDAIYQPKQWFQGNRGVIDQERIIADSVRRNESITRNYEHPDPGTEGSGIMIIPNYLDPTGECVVGKPLWYPTDGWMTSRNLNVVFEGTNVRLKR